MNLRKKNVYTPSCLCGGHALPRLIKFAPNRKEDTVTLVKKKKYINIRPVITIACLFCNITFSEMLKKKNASKH